jgi:hypothetical protein
VVIGIAIAMGILGGLVVKALFLKESNLTWDAIFGLVGGVAAYFLYRSLSVDVLRAVFALGTAVVVAGVLHEVWTRLGALERVRGPGAPQGALFLRRTPLEAPHEERPPVRVPVAAHAGCPYTGRDHGGHYEGAHTGP